MRTLLLRLLYQLLFIAFQWDWDPWDPFGTFAQFQFMFILTFTISIIIFVVVFIFITYMICRASRAKHLDTISSISTYDVTTLPRRTRRVLREQLPRECLECGAALKYNEVKWTGPHQAECPYCGHTTQLELIETTIPE